MRIIAGVLGGRRINAPRGRETRPTSDRVREAIFSFLGSVTGSKVLDLYAGSGALGIEALSRGAAHAVFVERAGATLKVLRGNLRDLELDSSTVVVPKTVARYLGTSKPLREGPFDLVFADPPYAALSDAARELEALVLVPAAISPDARIIMEHAARDEAPTVGGIVPLRTRRYGDTAVTSYLVAPGSEPVPSC